MKWFKHEYTFSNPKIETLKERCGATGYAVYFQILEIISQAIEKDTFEEWGFMPEEYPEDYLAKKLYVTQDELEAVLTVCYDLKLLELKDERIFCSKILERADEYTVRLRANLNSKKDNVPTVSGQSSDNKGDAVSTLNDPDSTTPDGVGTISGIRIEEEVEEEQNKNINTGKKDFSSSSVNKIGDLINQRIPTLTGKTDNRISASWQDSALRMAKALGIVLPESGEDPDNIRARWFKVFKEADSDKEKNRNTQMAYGWLVDSTKFLDAPNEGKVKLFFWVIANGIPKNPEEIK